MLDMNWFYIVCVSVIADMGKFSVLVASVSVL